MKYLLLLSNILILVSCAAPTTSVLRGTTPGSLLRHGTIILDLKTDKASYRDGDPVTITLTSSHRASVKLFNEDADGNRVQLWPNPHSRSSGTVAAGKILTLPGKGAAFALRASSPYGVNTLVAVASSSPFRPSLTPGDFFVDKHGTRAFDPKGMAWTPASTTGDSKSLTGEARFLYQVRK